MSMWRVGRESVGIHEAAVTPLDRSVAEARAAAGGAVAGTGTIAEAGAAGRAGATGGAGATGDAGAAAGAGSAGEGVGGPLGDIADTVAKWIPGEVLALYVAGVTMIGRPSWFWLVVGVLLAPATVLLAAFANSGRLPGSRTGVRAGFGFLAMVLWSLTVPVSGWQSWTVVHDNQAAVALAAGVVGLLFGLVAEGVSRWVDGRAATVHRHAGKEGRRGGNTAQARPEAAGRPELAAPERPGWATPPEGPPPGRRTADPQPLRMPSIPPLE